MEKRRWNEAVCGILTLNSRSEIRSVNQSLLALLGYEKEEELLGREFELLLSTSAQFYFYSMLYPKIQLEGYCQEIYLSLRKKDGHGVPVMFNAKRFYLGDEAVIDCIILPMETRREYLKEIKTINKKLETALEEKILLHEELLKKQEELEEMYRTLQEISRQDPLTGILNRRAFMEEIHLTSQRALKEPLTFSVCILDLDYFKAVNDLYGHHKGDVVLCSFSEHLTSFFGKDHIVARFGGEEFILLLRSLSREESKNQMEAFRLSMAGRTYGGLKVTASFGLSTWMEGDDPDKLIVKADMALYEAKRRGRDCVMHFDEMNQKP
ncbi:sensor domain-containing diguanylate cyclase [Proteiniclasticum ruminis]|uniref:Diguanylate cyclase (GGDEF) domain-containing protein n=1 Tax=Proteiniclasticum ruminis TaxID=398199 RepID=A0A1I4XKY2_9CLOT|nr:GGDEF domain-containing protein [Proteiniclasticum ruminis]SFN26475.1 diguanylate cyclase (GGDEF) domain-containing protein [Proteiniclasticum ruminis]